jgi:predicted ribosome quality control (RQC) complex YloA/Tae2 family protein
LSAKLSEKITGYTVVSCFSQNRDELVIELNNSRESFFIRSNFTPGVSCLSFPSNFRRARKNSIDLFKDIILKKVIAITQFQDERSFQLELEGSHALLFKMHNHFSNVLHLRNGGVQEIFRNHLGSDFEIIPEKLNQHIDFSKANFFRSISNLKSTYFTFGKVVWNYLEGRKFSQLEPETQWEMFRHVLSLLERPKYYLIELERKLTFSLVPLGSVVEEISEPIAALNEFNRRLTYDRVFFQEKNEALQQLHARLKGIESYLRKSAQKLDELINDHHYQLWGDLIMANLSVVVMGSDKVSLPNFYDHAKIEIKLKKELNPQRNAEVFYRKAKNQQIEVNKLKDAIAQKKNEKARLTELTEICERIDELEWLRKFISESGLNKPEEKQTVTRPFFEFVFKGYKILVGRNADSNDQLTLKHSYKDDLWLHAKDVAGSHVLIKYQAGKNFPKDVIEYAAGLAAYNSKRKNESLCPVAFTPKKYVRKRKGDPPGMVVVEKEEVILVEPRLIVSN